MQKVHQNKVVVIGAAIMDIMGFPFAQLEEGDSVPGNVVFTPGGVGRNLAENLGRLSILTDFISVFSNDWFSEQLVQSLEKAGIDINHSHFISNQNTATHLAIQNDKGDMSLGIAQLEILKYLDAAFISQKIATIKQYKWIAIEANLPQTTIEFLVNNLTSNILFLDPVSATMAQKVKHHIGQFHTIKANYLEAEVLSGIKIEQPQDLVKTTQFFLNKGVQRIFITQGKNGVFYADQESSGQIPAPKVKVVNTTGAGDALMAGIIWATVQKFTLEDCARSGLLAASFAVQHHNPVNPELTEEILLKK